MLEIHTASYGGLQFDVVRRRKSRMDWPGVTASVQLGAPEGAPASFASYWAWVENVLVGKLWCREALRHILHGTVPRFIGHSHKPFDMVGNPPRIISGEKAGCRG